MPAVTYSGPITVVESAAEIAAALRDIRRCSVVGFDTETRPAFRKGQTHNVALMQIATGDRCFLFRLNKTGLTQPIVDFLQDPSILKIGLSVHDDFTVMRRSTELEPRGFVDLQQTVKDYRIADISLQKIFAIVFGERISKAQRLTNWEADTLSDAQQSYAAIDAWACLRLYHYFKDGKFDPARSPYRHAPEPALH